MKKNMKNMICLVMVLLMVLSVPAAFAAEAASASITVTGTASVRIAPDFATVHIGVTTQAATVADAQAENSKLVTAVIEALAAQGIQETDMQTSQLNVSPVMNFEKVRLDGAPTIAGYNMSNTLQIIVRDLDELGTTIDAAMNAGANESYGLSFDSTGRSDAYDQALALATAEALRKATLLADAAQQTLGSLVSLTEQGAANISAISGRNMAFAAGAEMATTPTMGGELVVEATVTAAYAVK